MCQESIKSSCDLECYFLLSPTAWEGGAPFCSWILFTTRISQFCILVATPWIINAGFSFRNFKANVSTFQTVHKWVFSKIFNWLTLAVNPALKKVVSVSWHNPNALLTQELCQFKQFQREGSTQWMLALCSLHTNTEKSNSNSLRSGL